MGTSANSHDKKSDKETQSSLIRIFKEIIMRENNDSEKRNLLSNYQQQKEDRKRQHSSRSKIDRKSNASTSSEYRKRSPRKVSSMDQRNSVVIEDNQYAKEIKESWTNWGLREPQRSSAEENKDDTCSCVSCALRKIVDSEYACIVCLLLVFIISIGAACFMVFRTIPIVATASTDSPSTSKVYHRFKTADSERLKRKIDMINEHGMKNNLGEGGFGRIPYDDMGPDILDLPALSDTDFGTNFQDLTNLEDGDNKNSGDMELATFLEPEKLDVQGNDKLREFYKKLVETDAKIKDLKKIDSSESNLYNVAFGTKSPDRSRRSLKLYHCPKKRYNLIRRRRDLYNKIDKKHQKTKQKRRPKRFREDTDKPSGFVIENKKVIIQYQPADKRKVPKCSHTPKESNTDHHEHEHKHPFYQNSQRLDELLDRFFNKNLPEIMIDPFGLDTLFQQHKNKCKHPQNDNNNAIKIDSNEVIKSKEEPKINGIDNTIQVQKSEKFKPIDGFNKQLPRPVSKPIQVNNTTSALLYKLLDLSKIISLETTTIAERKVKNHETEMFEKDKPKNVENITVSANEVEVLLTMSTIMNKETSGTDEPNTWIPLIDRVPNIRRLMQAEGEEEDNLGYEDFKEVLTDDMENQDDVDRRGDRKKREKEADNVDLKNTATEAIINNEEQIRIVPVLKEIRLNPPGVHNPNWKGPMPLYPDELSSMMRHDINANKPSQPTPKNIIDEEDENKIRKRKHISDVEYVEDYLNNRYSKLVEMAQAYSDYGVLEGKKDNIKNEKNQPTDNISTDHKVKLSVDGNFQRRGLFGRIKESNITPFHFSAKGNNFINLLNEQKAAVAKTVSNLPSRHASEGIRIEIRPTTEPRDDDIQISKVIKSHFKFNHNKEVTNHAKPSHAHTSQSMSTYPDMEFSYNPEMNFTSLFEPIKKKILPNNNENDYNSNGLIFAINKGRALLSTQTKKYNYDDSIFREIKDTFDINSENAEYIFDEFLHDDKANRIYVNNVGKHINPDLTEMILKKYSDTEKNNNLPDNDKNKMHILNTQNVDKKLDVKTINPLRNGDRSDAMLFKSISNINDIRNKDSNKIIEFKPDEISITIARTEIKPNVLDTSKTEGQILLTYQNSDLGVQNIELKFDSPVTNNSIDQLPYDSFNTYFSEVTTLTSKDFQKNSSDDLFDSLKFNKRFKRATIIAEQIPVKNNGSNRSVLSTNTVNKMIPVNKFNNILNLSQNKNSNLSSKHSAVNNNATANDFFTLISNWFKGMDAVKMDRNRSHEINGSKTIDPLLKFNDKNNKSIDDNIPTAATTAHSPNSDISENITHRSRVLLSIKDNNITDEKNRERDSPKVTKVKSMIISGNDSNKTFATISPTNLAVNKTYNSTLLEHNSTIVSDFPNKYKGVKTKVKRNADDSNLIFWSDIYDDEYGIQTDNLDNIFGDKYVNKQSDFIKKSGKWMQDKFRKLADNLKSNPDSEMVARKKKPRAVRSVGSFVAEEFTNIQFYGHKLHPDSEQEFVNCTKYCPALESEVSISPSVQSITYFAYRIAQYPKHILDKIMKRDSAFEIDNNNDEKSMFHTLGAHMKEVCKKTAEAVKQTRNIEVKENSKHGTIATSLMQQLVGLMNELVDYQVQQKTCTKVPPDLQIFLEWLTLPEDHQKSLRNSDLESLVPKRPQNYLSDDLIDTNNEGKNSERVQDYYATLPEHEKDKKASYLDTMRSVQDLMEQYELMNNEDKSKMTGVNDYLQNQMKFLRNVLKSNSYNTYDKTDPIRYKRKLAPRKQELSEHRNKRKLHKFIKDFGKKHTRTTASFYDGVSISEMKKSRDEHFGTEDKFDQKKAVTKFNKRNLKDVYYHAIAEAKKYAKEGFNKGETVDFSTTQNVKVHSTVKN